MAAYTYTIRTDADLAEVTADSIDEAAAQWARTAGIRYDGRTIRTALELLSEIGGIADAWIWIESADAPDGARIGGHTSDALCQYLDHAVWEAQKHA